MLELHWVSLQSVAWVRMISADLQQEESLSDPGTVLDIVVRNVSGSLKCDLCLAISQERSDESEEEREARMNRRVELVPAEHQVVHLLPEEGQRLAVHFGNEAAQARSVPPLLPPPRSC